MRIAYLAFNLTGPGGTTRSVISQANALSRLGHGHQVQLLSVVRHADTTLYPVDPQIPITWLTDLRDPGSPGSDRPSDLVPHEWDAQFSSATDVGMRHVLPDLDVDVLVTVTPALLASAIRLLPDRTAVVHQEHRSTSQRKGGLAPLLEFAPRAAAVALLTHDQRDWLAARLGASAPRFVVMPNPLPPGFDARSPLDSQTIVTAGRLVGEKQFPQLVRAFASIADQVPGWRLRIFGEGPAREKILTTARDQQVDYRVDLPGNTDDMPRAWASASIAALSSKAEGYPLVLQEAMAAGVPCVSYDCPSGPREIITDGVDGLLVPPGDVGALGAALLRVATDDGLRHQMGAAARERSGEWNPTSLALRWERIFSEV